MVDDAAAPAEIRLAADHESVERHLLGLATALRVQHSDHSAGMVQSFHFPDSLPAIAAVLLEHACAGGLQARRKLRTEGSGAVVTMRIGAPAQMARAVKDVLDAHLQNDIGMRADPRTLQSDLAQQRVERGARLTLVDGIDPDQDAVLRAAPKEKPAGVNRRAPLPASSSQQSARSLSFLETARRTRPAPEDRGTSTVNQVAEHPVPANPVKQTKTVEELAAMIHQDLSNIEGSQSAVLT